MVETTRIKVAAFILLSQVKTGNTDNILLLISCIIRWLLSYIELKQKYRQKYCILLVVFRFSCNVLNLSFLELCLLLRTIKCIIYHVSIFLITWKVITLFLMLLSILLLRFSVIFITEIGIVNTTELIIIATLLSPPKHLNPQFPFQQMLSLEDFSHRFVVFTLHIIGSIWLIIMLNTLSYSFHLKFSTNWIRK